MFSETLKKLRKEKGLTQVQLAKLLKISKSSISMYENGNREPDFETEELIADFFNVSIDTLRGKPPFHNNSERFIAPSGTVPVYGAIPAGVPALAQQYIDEYILTTVPNPEDYFALKVKGTSMINAGIPDGCKVLCLKQNTAENGQIVCCRVNGDEATLKRFKQQGDMVVLMPENPAFDPQFFPASSFENGDAEILGVVKQIIIDL